jgi:hypothetical protein
MTVYTRLLTRDFERHVIRGLTARWQIQVPQIGKTANDQTLCRANGRHMVSGTLKNSRHPRDRKYIRQEPSE